MISIVRTPADGATTSTLGENSMKNAMIGGTYRSVRDWIHSCTFCISPTADISRQSPVRCRHPHRVGRQRSGRRLWRHPAEPEWRQPRRRLWRRPAAESIAVAATAAATIAATKAAPTTTTTSGTYNNDSYPKKKKRKHQGPYNNGGVYQGQGTQALRRTDRCRYIHRANVDGLQTVRGCYSFTDHTSALVRRLEAAAS